MRTRTRLRTPNPDGLPEAGDAKDRVGPGSDEEGRGNSEDPGPDDLSGDAPSYRGQPPRRTDADDGAGDCVGRAHRHAGLRGDQDRDRSAGLRGEAADRLK